jgi:hypothetical protein
MTLCSAYAEIAEEKNHQTQGADIHWETEK